MSAVASGHLIEVWPATAPDPSDSQTHFWYRAADSRYRRICDDSGWPVDAPLVSALVIDDSLLYVPCGDCKGLYTEDIVSGGELMGVVLEVPA